MVDSRHDLIAVERGGLERVRNVLDGQIVSDEVTAAIIWLDHKLQLPQGPSFPIGGYECPPEFQAMVDAISGNIEEHFRKLHEQQREAVLASLGIMPRRDVHKQCEEAGIDFDEEQRRLRDEA